MTTLPPGMYPPPHTPHGTQQSQPLYGQQLLPGWEQRVRRGRGGGDGGGSGTGGFGDAFEFSFGRYATLGVARLLYAVIVTVAALSYIGAVMLVFAYFTPDQKVGNFTVHGSPVPGLIALFLGWIPLLLHVLWARLILEHFVATVRTAVDARALRTQHVGSPVE